MESISKLDMRLFYSEEIFYINDCSVNDTGVLIRLKSKKHDCECPNCHQISNHYHGTYKRSVQDLPILGKNTSVIITAHEYECQNAECPTKTIVERYDHFLGYYGRFTERCEDFIATLALETSCEGASRICRYLGIQVSGDTIIRILKKRFAQMEIHTSKGSQGFPMGKPGHIADFSDELRTIGLTNAVDSHDCVVFRECGSQFIHFPSEPFHMGGSKV